MGIFLADSETLGLLSIVIFYGNKHYDSQWKYIFEVLVKGNSFIGELSEIAKENFLTNIWHLKYIIINILKPTSCLPRKMKMLISVCVV